MESPRVEMEDLFYRLISKLYPSPIRCDRKRNVDHENNPIIRENDRFFVEFEIRV